ncbi:hypothetical protein M3576_09480 [Weizmannia ginsengihumi]|nr:hypothetical protein [Heyndrickxia ginsengihumi]MBE6184028.1 hypothetical protein [Bacillus sp. (in: firmicutes)]MCM3023557.1 hypothetical protein [Heyndrickxia ginsengihumi]
MTTKTYLLPFFIFMIVFSFILNIFGLMRLLPIYITSPLLFIVICLFIIYLNGRNRFKGFTLKK